MSHTIFTRTSFGKFDDKSRRDAVTEGRANFHSCSRPKIPKISFSSKTLARHARSTIRCAIRYISPYRGIPQARNGNWYARRKVVQEACRALTHFSSFYIGEGTRRNATNATGYFHSEGSFTAGTEIARAAVIDCFRKVAAWSSINQFLINTCGRLSFWNLAKRSPPIVLSLFDISLVLFVDTLLSSRCLRITRVWGRKRDREKEK